MRHTLNYVVKLTGHVEQYDYGAEIDVTHGIQ